MLVLAVSIQNMAIGGTLLLLATMLGLTWLAKKRIEICGPPDISLKLKKTWIMGGIAFALIAPGGFFISINILISIVLLLAAAILLGLAFTVEIKRDNDMKRIEKGLAEWRKTQ